MNADDAAAKAREVVARLGKRQRWGIQPEEPKKAKKMITKRIWVNVSESLPAAHFSSLNRDRFIELNEQNKELELLFKGKGSSNTLTLPGIPEEPLHVFIQGDEDTVDRIVPIVEDLLAQAEQTQVDPDLLNNALVSKGQLTLQQLTSATTYKPSSVTSIIGSKPHQIDPTLPPDKLKAALLHYSEANVKETIQVPNHVVGFVIGRGGETIASLQAKFSCKVQIQKEADMAPGQLQRNIHISGFEADSVRDCKEAIMQMVLEQGGTIKSAQIVHVKVPDSDVGLIIGKGGCVIKNIQEQTNSTLKVPNMPDAGNPGVRTIQISSVSQEGATKAKAMVENILAQQPGGRYNVDGIVPDVKIQIVIPDKDVGLCIGRQGSVIRHMQTVTKTRIQIPNHANPGTTYRTADILGSKEGCDKAKLMIERIIHDQSSAAVLSGAPLAPIASTAYYGTHAAVNTQQQQQQQQQQTGGENDYREQFFRYWYYYGEKAARDYYGGWAPPPGTPNPYGENPNGYAPAPSNTNTAAPAASANTQPTAVAATAQPAASSQPAGPRQGNTARDTGQRGVSNLPAWMTKKG